MDKKIVAGSAENLCKVLDTYAPVDPEVAKLKFSLSQILRASLSEELDLPVAWQDVPGAYFFTEGELRKYKALEDAYSDFKIEFTGGETSVLREIRVGEMNTPYSSGNISA